MASNAVRRSSRHDPDNQPTTRSEGSIRSWRYAAVQGLVDHTEPSSACNAPPVRVGTTRADGYTVPSGSRISGPTAPAAGQRCATSSIASMLPGPHCTSGLAMTTHSAAGSTWATPRLAAFP
ncbi:Uncharacterised protein [Mycobacteroides abscessus subsp. abscessus]|nr:Uncharacterised protein [Mycobacteroides abscessus subsp. abscessus]